MHITIRRNALISLISAQTGVIQRSRRRVYERQRLFFNKRTETQTEIFRYIAHTIRQQLAQFTQLSLVDVH